MKRLSVGQATLSAALVIPTDPHGSVGDLGVECDRRGCVDKHGWIALGLGSFFSLVIGCGLMALMFFSSRYGYDDAADAFRKKQDPPTE